MRHVLYSLISLAVAFFCLMLGAISCLVLWSPKVRTDLVQFILEDSLIIFLFGFCFFLIGATILLQVFFHMQKRHYSIRSKNNSIYISEEIFQEYLNSYWKQLFPKNEIPNEIALKKNKVHISAELPFMPIHQQKAILQRIENDLSELFNRLIGYRKEYVLSISFLPQPVNRPLSTRR